jgi:hypothetical protein
MSEEEKAAYRTFQGHASKLQGSVMILFAGEPTHQLQ